MGKQSIADQIDELFFKQADGGSLAADEIALLAASGYDRPAIESEVARATRVRDNQERAGSAADREQSQQALIDAQTALADETPQIAAQIEALQRRQAELATAVRIAERKVESQTIAVKALRDNAPAHVQEFARNQRSIFNAQPAAQRMREYEGRRRMIEGVIAISLSTPAGVDAARLHAKSAGRRDLITSGFNGTTTIDHSLWHNYVQTLRAELPQLNDELQTLESAYAAGLAEIDQVLDVYLP